MIKYQVVNINFEPNFVRLSKWIKRVIISEKYEVGELFYIFCDDAYLLEINQRFLGHDTFTDIITFPTSKDPKILSRQIFISIPRVMENCKLLGTDFHDEFARVLIHGVLHLMGYEDHSGEEKRIMRQKEDKSLSLRAY